MEVRPFSSQGLLPTACSQGGHFGPRRNGGFRLLPVGASLLARNGDHPQQLTTGFGPTLTALSMRIQLNRSANSSANSCWM